MTNHPWRGYYSPTDYATFERLLDYVRDRAEVSLQELTESFSTNQGILQHRMALLEKDELVTYCPKNRTWRIKE